MGRLRESGVTVRLTRTLGALGAQPACVVEKDSAPVDVDRSGH